MALAAPTKKQSDYYCTKYVLLNTLPDVRSVAFRVITRCV